MIPSCFSEYRLRMPLLHEVTEWDLLRKWALSEVYRIKLTTGETRILKWCGGEMAREAEIYRDIVQPLQIKAPHIFEIGQRENSSVILMEDAGMPSLEEQPQPGLFLEAARELARLRMRATADAERVLSKKVIESYSVSKDRFVTQLDDLLKSGILFENSTLRIIRAVFPRHLELLYEQVPISLVHHDYHAKNLLIQGNSMMPIDWSNAYLSPHLGDLYCLVTEALAWSDLPREDVISAYHDVTDVPIDKLNWQINIGGLCWIIRTLHWLVNGGTAVIPGSEVWIPDLLQDAEQLYSQLNWLPNT